jgi:HPt (histidine-containing phosphotransfer) domain-containing protein
VELDEAVIGPLRELGGEALVAKLLGTFVAHAPQRRAELAAAVTERDLEALERAVHSLRSGAAMIGAGELSELAGKLEDLAGEGDLEGVLAAMPGLEARFDSLVAALERRIAGVG